MAVQMRPQTRAVAGMRAIGFSLCAIVTLLGTGCAQRIPESALALTPDTLKLRQLQTRRFETTDEKVLLQAGAGVLQDLGFNIDESETKLGVIVGSKTRDATEAGQIAEAILVGVLFGVVPPTDKEQKIRASLISKPLDNGSIAVRITFQRIVWNNQGQVSRTESVEDAVIYQEFFDKFSKAVFLSANQI
jgi:hypothetical protein